MVPVPGKATPIVYKNLIRPLLFKMDAERAHRAGETALRIPLVWAGARIASRSRDPRLETTLAGLTLPSPVGMAAGFDKECRVSGHVLDLGFGFATAGTVTQSPRPGNSRPRVIRQPERLALVNSLGFPGPGLEIAEKRLARQSKNRDRIFVSVSGTIEDEVIECHRRLQPLVAAVELNISSPNTAGLRVFHEPARLRSMVEALASVKTVPLLVKIPPWPGEVEARRDALRLVETAVMGGADGIIVANTHPVEHSGLASKHGGLSGAPLTDHTARMVAEAKAAVGGDADIIASGGVSTAADVWQMLALGASATQLYTAFVYEGPGLPGRITRDLSRMMERAGITSITDIGGLPPD